MSVRQYAVYRCYADDELLYVGCSSSLASRVEEHARRPWWGNVTNLTLTHFATRKEALAAEQAAIETEAPVYNLVHNVQRRVLSKGYTAFAGAFAFYVVPE